MNESCFLIHLISTHTKRFLRCKHMQYDMIWTLSLIFLSALSQFYPFFASRKMSTSCLPFAFNFPHSCCLFCFSPDCIINNFEINQIGSWANGHMLNGPRNLSGASSHFFIGSKSTRAASATLKRISSRCRPSRNNFISKHQKYKNAAARRQKKKK